MVGLMTHRFTPKIIDRARLSQAILLPIRDLLEVDVENKTQQRTPQLMDK